MESPSLRSVLKKLLHELNCEDEIVKTDHAQSTSVVVQSLPQRVQTSLEALHQIYPTVLLSSLDLLDNILVTRYIAQGNTESHKPAPIYYVRSSQTRHSRYGGQAPRTVYEVRPVAWHCTCPSFTFSAFSSRNAFDPYECGEEDFPDGGHWGGEMRGGQLGICKHLLAVVIGERLKMIPEKEVDMHTLAGYAFMEA